MDRRSPRLRTPLLLLLGVGLLFLAGVPPWYERGRTGGDDGASLAPYLTTLVRSTASRFPGHPANVAAMQALVLDPVDGVRRLEESLRRMAEPTSATADVVAEVAGLVAAEGIEVRTPEPMTSDLPVRAIARLGDRGLDLARVSAENSAAFPPELRAAIASLVVAVERCDAAVRAERVRLAGAVGPDALIAMLERWSADPVDPPRGTTLEGRVVRAVDRSLLLRELHALAAALDRALPVLRASAADRDLRSRLRVLPSGDGVPGNLVFAGETAAGLLLIGGPGTTVLPLQGVAIALDLAGDDHWHDGLSLCGEGDPVPATTVVVDLDGMDQYTAVRHGIGAAGLSVALSLDASGNDRYVAEVPAFGAARLGAALHVDLEGDDDYRVARGSLGFGFLGAGVLLDAAGDDRYQAESFSIGCGSAGGVGLLVDGRGRDFYLSSGGEGEERRSFALGAGVPAFLDAPGGVGVLFDAQGNDVHRLSAWGAGFSIADAMGVLLNLGGDDAYHAAEASLGSSHKGGIALFLDDGGDDRFLSRGYSQGFSDDGLAVFVNRGGDDDNVSLEPSRGVASSRGTAVYSDR